MAKKIFTILMAGLLTFSLAACGNDNQNAEKEETQTKESKTDTSNQKDADSEAMSEEETATSTDTQTTGKSLVVYFSWSGNTRTVAENIQKQTGADIFEIIPEEPYTDDYDELLDIAQAEQREAARPAISGTIENFDSYDVIYLGFPNWWGDMPMILYSFLDNYDLSGKTLAPFVTSGGSGFSNSINTMEEMEPEANIVDGLSISDSGSDSSEADVSEWLTNIGMEE